MAILLAVNQVPEFSPAAVGGACPGMPTFILQRMFVFTTP